MNLPFQQHFRPHMVYLPLCIPYAKSIMKSSLGTEPSPSRKPHRPGFQIGPANLPDGVHRRKGKSSNILIYSSAGFTDLASSRSLAQKIKQSLIRKAQLKRSYAKLLSTDPEAARASSKPLTPVEPASLDPHPARQSMILQGAAEGEDVDDNQSWFEARKGEKQVSRVTERGRRGRSKAKPQPFRDEIEAASRRKDEEHREEEERARGLREKEEKRVKRECERKQMALAKGRGKGAGQRKLGRESGVLLERIRRSLGT